MGKIRSQYVIRSLYNGRYWNKEHESFGRYKEATRYESREEAEAAIFGVMNRMSKSADLSTGMHAVSIMVVYDRREEVKAPVGRKKPASGIFKRGGSSSAKSLDEIYDLPTGKREPGED